MAARTSPVLVKKIRHLRRQGLQISAIAQQLGVARSTAAKYAVKVDQQADLEDVVAGLTLHQRQALMNLVELPTEALQLLAGAVGSYQCSCGAQPVYLTSAPKFRCQGCGAAYEVGPPQPTGRASAAEVTPP